MRAPTSSRWLACLTAGLLCTSAYAAAPLTPDEVQTLDSALRDRSTPMKVRLEAALLAGRGGGPELVPALLEALGDPEFPVRAAAALSLGTMGDARAADGLIGRLADPEAFVRDEARDACAAMVKRGYGRALEEQVRHFPPPTRAKVAEVGGSLGFQQGERLVAQALADPDPSVHSAALDALSGWGPGRTDQFLDRALTSDDARVRAAAARELGHRRSSQSIPALTKLLVSPNEPRETIAAARDALAEMSGEVDLRQLIQQAHEGSREERAQAMAVLAAIRVSDSYTVLESALDDADLGVRADAATDLAVLGDKRAANHLAVLAERPENASIQPVLLSALHTLQGK